MPAILRTTDQHPGTSGVAFNFEDMAAQAQGYLERVRGEAAKIVAEARGQAGAIRQQAQQEGRHAAMLAAEETIHKQLTGTLAALGRAVEDLRQAKQAWLAHWEAAGVHVAAAIARRLIRRRPIFPESVSGWLAAASGPARALVAQAVGCVPIVVIPVGNELSSSLCAGQIALPSDRGRGLQTFERVVILLVAEIVWLPLRGNHR